MQPFLAATAIFLLLILPQDVFAHGFLRLLTINDHTPITGLYPKASSTTMAAKNNAIRQISDPSPIKGAMNLDVTCGTGAQKAMGVLDVMPGDSLGFLWSGADGSKWPHNTGPVLTYMASCGAISCAQFDSTTARWFKIAQVGKQASSDAWVQADLKDGKPTYATLPSNLAPGNYLLRHEIIALHLANSFGGAEFYPACVQTRVGGTQTGVPAQGFLVSLPGAYKDSDPGIYVANAFETSLKYLFPGPPIAVLSGRSTVVSSSFVSTSPATSTSKPAKTSSRASTKPSSANMTSIRVSSTSKITPTSARTSTTSASPPMATSSSASSTKKPTITVKPTSVQPSMGVSSIPTGTNKPSKINPPTIYCDEVDSRDLGEYNEDADEWDDESDGGAEEAQAGEDLDDGAEGDADDSTSEGGLEIEDRDLTFKPSSQRRYTRRQYRWEGTRTVVSSRDAGVSRRTRQMHKVMHRHPSRLWAGTHIEVY